MREPEPAAEAGSLQYEQGEDSMNELTSGLREALPAAGLHRRPAAGSKARDWNLDRDFPPWNGGPWPEGFTVSREQIYDDMGRLTGGPEDDSEAGG